MAQLTIDGNSRDAAAKLKVDYPWIRTPVVASAPMRLIADIDLTLAVCRAGGIGFLAGGTDVSQMDQQCQKLKEALEPTPIASRVGVQPYGLGFITWGAPLEASVAVIQRHKPAAVWFFAPQKLKDLVDWTQRTRAASPETRIWIQVGTVADAIEATELCQADVLVLQGQDAGGHGYYSAASIVSLVPEVEDRLEAWSKASGKPTPIIFAAGGIMDSRAFAAALTLGAHGIVLGTRLLAANEAIIADGYQEALFAAEDGGTATARSNLYDTLRGTLGWPEAIGGRGVLNRSWEDSKKGMSMEDNKILYDKAMKLGAKGWGFDKQTEGHAYVGKVEDGRMTAYAGTGVGLLKRRQPAAEIVLEVREGVMGKLTRASGAMLP
ncbi:inosine monophosphate dehydrogenase [Pseudovirgaria hyperparasitica]|uniref:Inosine monophosphate dehydrogenase n=1 Tax=Pseudovirgaria hyperparasitica TaxID=470096 RepID=A0A6A6WE00_9PEZI|nr:inosine monophosphate dehydrogenase [Pseudovirgaria hyperparasitica]KAF2759341.1 inosine monophosphate dehydrogenase [Pseudovirgaria hyperparasitica]